MSCVTRQASAPSLGWVSGPLVSTSHPHPLGTAEQPRGALSEVQHWNLPPYLASAEWRGGGNEQVRIQSPCHASFPPPPAPRPNSSGMNGKSPAAFSLHVAPWVARLGPWFLSSPPGTTSCTRPGSHTSNRPGKGPSLLPPLMSLSETREGNGTPRSLYGSRGTNVFEGLETEEKHTRSPSFRNVRNRLAVSQGSPEKGGPGVLARS